MLNSYLQFDGKTYLAVNKPQDFDLTGHDFTITARIRTRRGGAIFAKTATGEKWVADGKALFVRGGRLVYDIGWVGAVTSRRRVNDGKWYDVALTWKKSTGDVRLYINGKLDRSGQLSPKNAVRNHEVRIGFAAPDFPRSRSHFNGSIAGVRFFDRQLTAAEIGTLNSENASAPKGLVAQWKLKNATGESIADAARKHDAVVRRGKPKSVSGGMLVAGVMGQSVRVNWTTSQAGDLRLVIPRGDTPLRFTLAVARVTSAAAAKGLSTKLGKRTSSIDLTAFTTGGPPRWPQKLMTRLTAMKKGGPFDVDVFTRPVANPWFCRVRFTGLDFLPDGRRMAACTWDGDVWMVDGIGNPDGKLTWQRIASGLFQPLGLKFHRGKIYVACRDQITILHDLNGDGETDFYENFNSDHQVTEHFHEFAMGLQTDAAGNFYYAKSARHALPAIVPHHGTLLKVSSDGSKTQILANGFRAANGVCLNPDGTFYVTDQEGHWNPKNRINRVKPGGFYGNMYGYHNVKSSADDAMEQPLCWITNAFDRSPAELLWVRSRKWGPLNNALLSLSYGYGKIFVVLRQKVGEQMQGGVCELPLPSFPTGLIRGRFHPHDGQLYACGMFAWAGSRQQPGGLYRIRYTGRPVNLPIGLKAKPGRIVLTFTDSLDPAASNKPAGYAVKIWSLKRTKNYGSKHYDERSLNVASVVVRNDGKTVELRIPNLKPTWGMEIKYAIRAKDGSEVRGVIHNTIHRLTE